MAEKRRDSKGRVLRSGEYQRSDGKYEYKYIDAKGVRRSLYSWKLVETDKPPAGKRCGLSLREMVKDLRRDSEDGIDAYAGRRVTLNSLFSDYISTKGVHLTPSCYILFKLFVCFSEVPYYIHYIYLSLK